tara:strand:- start:312 stop:905 length:594 start_codon:yes stop_codon:yes gene_type:complete
MHKLDLPKDQEKKIQTFVEEAFRYNKAHNLFVRKSIEEIYQKDINDCFPLIQFIEKNDKILDVGTGAGFPGMLIGITRPDTEITLVESNKKKTYFLKKTIRKLEIPNIKVQEEHLTNKSDIGVFDVVTARAFSQTQNILNICNPFLQTGGRYLLLKGKEEKILEEIETINKKEHKCEIIRIKNKYEERHILVITKQN